jgi:hypothetical protein
MKPKNAIALVASAVVGLGLAVSTVLASDAPAHTACAHAKDGNHHCMHKGSMATHEHGKANHEHHRMHDSMHQHHGRHGMHDRAHRGDKHGMHHKNCPMHEAAPK